MKAVFSLVNNAKSQLVSNACRNSVEAVAKIDQRWRCSTVQRMAFGSKTLLPGMALFSLTDFILRPQFLALRSFIFFQRFMFLMSDFDEDLMDDQ